MSEAEEWTVKSLLAWTTSFFKKKGLESPRLEAEILLAHAMNATRVDLFVRHEEKPSEEAKAAFRDLVRRRGQGEPVAYLIGKKEFFTLDFAVDRSVLIPRPETEELATAAVQYARKSDNRYGKKGVSAEYAEREASNADEPAGAESEGASESASGARPEPEAPGKVWRVCDVGTGSGCIAVSIAKELPNSEITAIDLSEDALRTAEANAEAHGVADRIEFLCGDLLSGVPSDLPEDRRFDIIASNPPYVSEPEYAELEPTVRDYEPPMALIGGPTGAELPIRLLDQAPDRLRSGGRLFMELSPTTVRAAAEHAGQDARWTDVEIVKDLSRLERFLFATRR